MPAIIYSYNRYMNGVDRSDQLNILRQTRKDWKTLFLHYVDIAIVNSYILYKELHSNARLRMSHFTFRETLVRQLCHIQVSLHQSVAGRKCDTTIEHRSEGMPKGRDCVYCKLVHGVNKISGRREANGFNPNPFIGKHQCLKDDLREAQSQKEEGNESVRTGEIGLMNIT